MTLTCELQRVRSAFVVWWRRFLPFFFVWCGFGLVRVVWAKLVLLSLPERVVAGTRCCFCCARSRMGDGIPTRIKDEGRRLSCSIGGNNEKYIDCCTISWYTGAGSDGVIPGLASEAGNHHRRVHSLRHVSRPDSFVAFSAKPPREGSHALHTRMYVRTRWRAQSDHSGRPTPGKAVPTISRAG